MTDQPIHDNPEIALLLVGVATLAVPPFATLLLVGASVSTLAILAR